MSRQKIYNYSLQTTPCLTCSSLGLTHHFPKNPPDLSVLSQAGYTHLAVACGAEISQEISRQFKILKVVHDLAQIDPRPDFEYVLVTSELSQPEFLKTAPTPLKYLLWIPHANENIFESVKWLHPSWNSKFHAYWPHPYFLGKMGWEWKDLLERVRQLSLSFPYLKFAPPQGLDVYNPDNDFETEPKVTELFGGGLDPGVRVSIVIPAYENTDELALILRNLLSMPDRRMEIIVADDGSSAEMAVACEKIWRDFGAPNRLRYIYVPRPQRRSGRGGFRASIARNCGVRFAQGDILLFLDSDILIDPNYIEHLVEKHKSWDVIQGRRVQLSAQATKRSPIYSEIDFQRDLEPTPPPWSTFNSKISDWNAENAKWKFASTYCLSVKKKSFLHVGGFRRSFNSYGFEDTDLGYRLAKDGEKFYLSPHEVCHLKPTDARSEYGNKPEQKEVLLKHSSQIFFLNNPYPDVLETHARYLKRE